ncbi:alpha/beta fold hydrolase [Nesterenkonia populi]|uniref:alpha/beta fold hydrolase n=1 Tax=Nesterenkonia populi TaxID=1591087 RepID=UPI001FE931D9|nr:alpha/beta fold hydrolase [Nesterenkonia populi]
MVRGHPQPPRSGIGWAQQKKRNPRKESLVGYPMPGMWVQEHTLDVPLNWENPAAETIRLFVRELVHPEKRSADLPLLLFLQGGPGGANPRPTAPGSWIKEALEHYRIILADQRGTGRSTPLEARDVAERGSAEAGADYLALFRADSIIRDVEHVRHTLFGGRKWATLGQSYGGFLTLTYLSFHPEALAACYVTGGIPGVPPRAADIYARTFPRVEEKTAEYYRRYPQDADTIAQIADLLMEEDVLLPDGDRLTVRRFQSLGQDFGMKPGFERMHWLAETAFARPGRLSEGFLEDVQVQSSQAGRTLYWTLQEAIYADPASGPTGWAAQAERDRRSQFSEGERPLLLTGEMSFPWMFEEIRALKPMAPAVNALHRKEDWAPIYDLERLASNEVPLAAAVYFDDMFVDAELSLGTLSRIGNSQRWVTNEFEHDGIGSGRTFTRLRDLVADRGGEQH